MYRLNQNQDIVEMLERLKELRAEYPAGLLVARRHFFINLVNRYIITLL